MKITSVDVWPVSIPFVKPFEVWRGVARTKDHVIVEVHTDEGISGIGEASPFLYYAAETQEDVVATLTNHLAPMVRGLDPFDTERLNRLFDTVVDGHHFSKAAIEMALWDIIGKALGVPVYRLLGGSVRDAVEVIALLDNGRPAAMAAQAADRVEAGYRHLKVKIGFDPATDVAMVAAVVGAVGRSASVRVDAEESYDLKTSLRIARRLEELEVELLSQPISRHHHRQMARLRETISIPLLVDESIEIPADVMLAADLGTGDLVNIKVVKCGGILKAKRMAAIAEGAGMDCLVGSMIEMGPGTACGAHVAISTPNVTYASELVGPQLIDGDVLVDPIEIHQGRVRLPDRPGLGVELDRERLARYATAAS
ncbi:MAG: hypothetical protein OXS29_11240 [bacterium]|nr:hypothetical protein [bacterium]MDE0287938.1 hypothetical protein [bacterium]MDE0439683.1 hypothetical protein [bacterium]